MRLFESYFKHSASSTTASILNCCNLLLQSSRGFKIVVECFNQSWSSQHFWACFMTPYNFITLGICNEKAILNVHCVKDHHLHCFHSSHLNYYSIKLNPTKGSKGNFSFWYPEKYLEILKSKPVSSQSWGNLNNWHSKLRSTTLQKFLLARILCQILIRIGGEVPYLEAYYSVKKSWESCCNIF